ncbi:MAG: SusC/RagA family TonB-linked outer membrane protein [Bacteroidota bacterium]|nr:SusC/RagA family TonB-linked outer membrane protein [Bacteroidota bacterium]
MKLTIVFLALGLLNARAEGFSQAITFSGKNVALTKVFNAIEKQTGYSIFANKGLLTGAKPVSLSVKDMPLKDFLNATFRDQPVDYEISNKTIFIKKKFAATSSTTVSSLQSPVQKEIPLQEITGTVKSAEGGPLEGATITVKGTKNSVATNAAGLFSINAEPGQTLVITFIGFRTIEEPINGRSNIDVVMQKVVNEIEQVVVTALGIPKKTKALTYNVQEVKGDELNKVKDANFVNSLTGKVAGVTINSASSGIGGSARVVMRGAKSLQGNNNALYVVDGIPLPSLQSGQPADVFSGANATGDGASNLNPEDIASVSVLTGPSATALYGSQAANGVILITTKKGTAGKLNVSFINSTNFYSPFVLPRFQNEYGSDPQDFFSWGTKLKTTATYDPIDFFQTGTNVTNAISLSTGTDKNQTYFSGTSINAKGIIPNNKLTRYNFSIRNTSSFLDDKFNLDLGIMYVKAEEQNMLSQGQYFNPLIPIYLFPRGDDIEKYQVYERYNAARNFKTQFWPFGDMGFQMQNPYWIINRDKFNTKKDRYIMSVGLKYNLKNWISITGRVKIDNNVLVNERKYFASTSGLFASPDGAYYNNNTRTRQTYADVIATANKSFGDYSLNVNAGSSISDEQQAVSIYGGPLLHVPNLFDFGNVDMSSGQTIASQANSYHDQTQSVFASAQLGYRNMVFLDATARNDWPSTLANTAHSSFFYPSVGLSAILSDLLKFHSSYLSFIKVRAAYGEAGNPPERFVTIPGFALQGGYPVTTSYLAGNIEPEHTKSYEAGINMRLLRNKINLDVTAYKSDTYNQLFHPGVAPSTGYSSLYINGGQVTNKGIEAVLGYNSKIWKLDWSSSLAFGLNRNKIVKLLKDYKDPVTGQMLSQDSLYMGGTGSYSMYNITGGSIGDIYVTTLATDEHGYIAVNSASQTVSADPNNTLIKAGNASPRYNIGFRNSITYKNFNLNFLINARIGGVCVSVTQAIMDRFGVSEASAIARDQGGAIVNGYKIPAAPYYAVVGGGVAGIGSMYVYSATNVRLGEASFGYTFPAKFFHNKIQGITLSVIGRNLFMFYNKAPFDPETTANTGTYYQGVDYFMQPSLRSVGFSAKIQF